MSRDVSRDGVPLEDQVRKARSEGATYRELCKAFKLSPNQIKPILDGDAISSIKKLEKRKNEIENEVKNLEFRASQARKQINEVYNYKPLMDVIDEMKKVNGAKNYVLYVWWNWMKRSGISVHDMAMFFKKQRLKKIELEAERLEAEENRRWRKRMGLKPESEEESEEKSEKSGFKMRGIDWKVLENLGRSL